MNSALQSLEEQIFARGQQIYVVVDGALVQDISSVFSRNGLTGKSLFNERAAVSLAMAGPWMFPVSGKSETDLRKAFAVARIECQSGVVWCAPCGQEAMENHLKKLNAARLPSEGLVYFRHYDADVLASVCPMLDAAQAARLLGPADSISFLVGRGAGAMVERPSDLPQPQSGPLHFYDWQVEQLTERQRDISRTRICAFLRKVLPKDLRNTSDEALRDELIRHERSAKSLGLDSERAITQWAHLNIISKRRIGDDRTVRDIITKNGSVHANRILDKNFYDFVVAYTRSNASGENKRK